MSLALLIHGMPAAQKNKTILRLFLHAVPSDSVSAEASKQEGCGCENELRNKCKIETNQKKAIQES